MPTSEEDAIQQLKEHDEFEDLVTLNMLIFTDEGAEKQRTYKLLVLNKRWEIADKFDQHKKLLSPKKWETNMSAFPYIHYKKRARRDYPRRAATQAMIAWLIENLKGFDGIPDEFPIPTGDALKNFYGTFCDNNLRPLQALFAAEKGYNQAMALYYHISAKLTTSLGTIDALCTTEAVAAIADDMVSGYSHSEYKKKSLVFPKFPAIKLLIDAAELEARQKAAAEELRKQTLLDEQQRALNQ